MAPGRTDVHAEFALDQATVDALRRDAAGGGKVLRWFQVDVTNATGGVVARVRKQIYVRLKPGVRGQEHRTDAPA